MATGKIKMMFVVFAGMVLAGGGLLWAAGGAEEARPDSPSPSATPVLAGPDRLVRSVAPLPDGTALGPGHVADIRFSPDGKQYLVHARGIQIHDAAIRRRLWHAPGSGAGYSADGKTILVAGAKKVEARDAVTGKILKEHPRPKTNWAWHLVSFSPDGKRYAAHYGFHVRLYDTATGFEPVHLDNQTENPGGSLIGGSTGQHVAWSPDGTKVAAVGVLVGRAGILGSAVWDAKSGKQLHLFDSEVADAPHAVAFAADGKSIAVGMKNRVEIWQLEGKVKKNPARTFRTAGQATAVAYSKDGKRVAAGIRKPGRNGFDNIVQVFHAASGDVELTFDGFADRKLSILGLAFSPDGKTLIAGTGSVRGQSILGDPPVSGEVKAWKLDEDKEQPPRPPGRGGKRQSSG